MLADMSTLNDFPEIYLEFVAVDYFWKICYKVITGKVTEITPNRDTKTPVGTTEFSTNTSAMEKRVINVLYWESLRRVFYQYLQYKFSKYNHKDLLSP